MEHKVSTDKQAAVELDYATYSIQQNYFAVREWDDYAEYLRLFPDETPEEQIAIFAGMLENECIQLCREEISNSSAFVLWCAEKWLKDINWLALAAYYWDDIEELLNQKTRTQ